MKSFLLAIVAVLMLVASAEAGGVVFRRTPFRPFVGPVAVGRGFNNNFNRGVIVAPGFSRGFVPSYGFNNGFNGSRGIGYGGYSQPTIVFDQFGRAIIIR